MVTTCRVGASGVGGNVQRASGERAEMGERAVKIAVKATDARDALPAAIHGVGAGGVGLVDLCVVGESFIERASDD